MDPPPLAALRECSPDDSVKLKQLRQRCYAHFEKCVDFQLTVVPSRTLMPLIGKVLADRGNAAYGPRRADHVAEILGLTGLSDDKPGLTEAEHESIVEQRAELREKLRGWVKRLQKLNDETREQIQDEITDLRNAMYVAMGEGVELLRVMPEAKFRTIANLDTRISNRINKARKAYMREYAPGASGHIHPPETTNETRKRNGQEPHPPLFRHTPDKDDGLPEPSPVMVESKRVRGVRDAGPYIPSRQLEYQPACGDDEADHIDPTQIELTERERDAIRFHFGKFTELQQQVIKLLWEGFAQERIADILCIPLCRVKSVKQLLAERADVAIELKRHAA